MNNVQICYSYINQYTIVTILQILFISYTITDNGKANATQRVFT
jgi:hypothetical protein